MPSDAVATPPTTAAVPAAKPAAAAAAKPSAVRTPSTSPSKPVISPSKPTSAAPAKVTNPFDESFADMEKFADPSVGEPMHPATPKKQPKPAPVDKEEPGSEPETELEEQPTTEEQPKADPKIDSDGKPVAEEKPGKTSPWKLVESYKKTNAQLQKEIADLRLSMKPGELPKEAQEKFTALETRNKELEDEIRHVNYSKSKEFQERYQKPYEEAWTNALADLKELTITNDDGTSRQATVQDLLALSNMPLGQARQAAKAWFGDSADDVMAHRRNLRDLSDKQTKALEDSKKMGTEREQQRAAQMQAKQKAMAEEIATVWNGINAEAVEKYDFLRPVDGETDRNERLENATKFVDDTLKKNIGQAKTPEERDAILRAHAALRNRAIGFSVLKHENKSLKSKVEELEKALAEFQGSEPTIGDPRSHKNGELRGDTLEGAINSMARLAS